MSALDLTIRFVGLVTTTLISKNCIEYYWRPGMYLFIQIWFHEKIFITGSKEVILTIIKVDPDHLLPTIITSLQLQRQWQPW